MAFFKTNDHEGEELLLFFTRQGLTGEALDLAVREAKRELSEGKPLAYITKEAYFYDRAFYVDEAVLIPRPDTEHIVEKAIGLLPKGAVFADLGTGSGCIAITVLMHRPDVSGFAVDLSKDALQVAEKNARDAGVLDRLTLVHGDMFENPLRDTRLDLVISNPPYIPTRDIARYPSLRFEPRMALDGGEDGMDFYRAILSGYQKNLCPKEVFLFEIGFDQGDAIRALAERNGYAAEVYKDYGKNDRLALLYRKA